MTDNSIYFDHATKCTGFMQNGDLDRCLRYICKDLFAGLDETMIGLGNATKELRMHQASTEATVGGNVANELKTFGKECTQICC